MKKKLLSLTILTSLILSLFSVMPSTAAASELTADSFTYTVSDNQATVTKADAALTGEVSIPSELNGYTVVCIGEGAFRGNTAITDITIPDTVTTIRNDAFKDCTGLSSVTLGSGIEIIPSNCFQGCSALKEVTIGKNVTKIDSSAFRSCTSLSTIKWGSKLETIASSVFFNCRSLSVVEIPDTVISIDSYAFKNCSGIKELTIGKKVSYIGYESFRNCTGLKNIVISENVTTIDGYAFYSCSDVTEVYFPAGLQSVADNAFDNCSSITDVYYESSKNDWNHVSIGNGNTSLTNAVFHENYKEKDHTNPVATISSANAVAANQTVTLTLSDNAGVVSYYWGTSSSPDNSSFTSITSTTIRTETKTVSDSGTYYLIVKDAAGNSFSTKITFCKTTLNATNGTVTPSYIITKSGESFALPTAKKDGFKFLGWASDSNATSANYSEGTTYTPSSDTTLYAIWEADKKESLPGDVNGDGVVDAGDAVIISRYDTGLVTLTDTQIVIADVNNDGCADAGDAVIISRYDAGLISSLK